MELYSRSNAIGARFYPIQVLAVSDAGWWVRLELGRLVRL